MQNKPLDFDITVKNYINITSFKMKGTSDLDQADIYLNIYIYIYISIRFVCINSDPNFHYSPYLKTVIVNVNNHSLYYTYLRTVLYRYVYNVTLYLYVTCLIATSLLGESMLFS